MKFGLDQKTYLAIKTVLSAFPGVERVVIYGSRAKGNYRNGSDIDIVLIAPKLKLTDLSKLEEQIDELMLPYRFDLSLYHHIDNPSLIDHIQRIGIEF